MARVARMARMVNRACIRRERRVMRKGAEGAWARTRCVRRVWRGGRLGAYIARVAHEARIVWRARGAQIFRCGAEGA